MGIFDEWRSGATQLHWQSSTAANAGAEVSVFTRRCGTPGAPALVCVHGFPTASIDYFALTRELGAEHFASVRPALKVGTLGRRNIAE